MEEVKKGIPGFGLVAVGKERQHFENITSLTNRPIEFSVCCTCSCLAIKMCLSTLGNRRGKVNKAEGVLYCVSARRWLTRAT